MIPWFQPDGSLANMKFRKVDAKAFWYAKGGVPLRNLVYGIDVIYRKRLKRAVICEAEIDAMYIMSAGYPAIAIGGTGFTEVKRELIVRSPLEEIVIMADHDRTGLRGICANYNRPGQTLKRRLIAELSPYMNVRVAGFPIRYKDPNEIGNLQNVAKYVESAKGCVSRLFRMVR